MSTSGFAWRATIVPALALALVTSFCTAAGAESVGETDEAAAAAAEITADQLRLAQEVKQGMRNGKVSGELIRIHDEHLAKTQAKAPGGEAPALQKGGLRMATPAWVVDGQVIIDATAEDGTAQLREQLKGLGFEETASFGRIVSGRLPIEAIGALNDLPALKFARASYAKRNAGAVTSQGDRAMWAEQARDRYDVTGAGETVGVLSDSFDCLGGYQAAISSGDLPSNVTILAEGACPATDEGRAIAEIIHDVAPGAALSFHTADGGIANFAQGIKDLADAGATIIVDDVIYFAEPMFQDGPVAQAVDQVTASGVSYFSSAGNCAKRSYEAPFRPAIRNGTMTVHDFDPGAKVVTAQTVTIPGYGLFLVSFQWDQPFFSASGAPGAQSDLDLHFFYRGEYLGSCNDANIGGDAVEVCGIENLGSVAGSVTMVVELYAGPAPGLIKYVDFGNSKVNFATRSGTSFGHANAAGAVAVGAADYRKTPEYNKSVPVLEAFSSAGGVPILFDTFGNPLAQPLVREVPWIVAPDGVDTTFFGGGDPDHTGRPNFFGTSAAAPHAAAVAALMREDSPVLTPAEIRSRMAETAIDMGPAGDDRLCGHGFLDAEFAVGDRPLGPDLMASWLAGTVKQVCSTKKGVTTCSKLSGTLLVANAGNQRSKPTEFAFYLSKETTLEDGVMLGSKAKTLANRLGRDKTAKMPVTFSLPKDLGGASVAGWHLIAVIDPGNKTGDPADNNVIAGDIP